MSMFEPSLGSEYQMNEDLRMEMAAFAEPEPATDPLLAIHDRGIQVVKDLAIVARVWCCTCLAYPGEPCHGDDGIHPSRRDRYAMGEDDRTR
jgi:hypothetical protein